MDLSANAADPSELCLWKQITECKEDLTAVARNRKREKNQG